MRNKPKFATCDVRNIICGIPGNREGIPRGRVVTYGDISVALKDDVNAAQAVAGCVASLGEKFSFDKVPVHRVVKSKGHIPTRTGVKEKNTKELEKESICVLKDKEWKVKNFEEIHWEIPKFKRPKS